MDKYQKRIVQNVFKRQDEVAQQSEVFKRILQSEIHQDPETRYKQTNSPKSKTRNALIVKHIYATQEEWEKDLLTNPFYSLNKPKCGNDGSQWSRDGCEYEQGVCIHCKEEIPY